MPLPERRVYVLHDAGSIRAVPVRRKPGAAPGSWLQRLEGAPAWWAGSFLVLVLCFSWWGVLQWITGPEIIGLASVLTAWAVALHRGAREQRARRQARPC